MAKHIFEIRFRTLDSYSDTEHRMLENMSHRLFDFKGWIEERIYTESSTPKLIKELIPINGFPIQRFRDAMKREGVVIPTF